MALLRSPLYEVHAQAGATFQPQDGWELAQVFSSSAEEFRAAEDPQRRSMTCLTPAG